MVLVRVASVGSHINQEYHLTAVVREVNCVVLVDITEFEVVKGCIITTRLVALSHLSQGRVQNAQYGRKS